MNESQNLDELLVSRSDQARRLAEPCTVVIFGASGDLTSRKLIPALYHLTLEKLMPQPFRIVGFARREKNDEAWRTELREALNKFPGPCRSRRMSGMPSQPTSTIVRPTCPMRPDTRSLRP